MSILQIKHTTNLSHPDKDTMISSSFISNQPGIQIIITDLKGNVKYINSFFTDVTGYTYNEVMEKKADQRIFGDLQVEIYKNIWSNVTKGDNWCGEVNSRKKGGELITERLSIYPIKNIDNNIIAITILKEDMTKHNNTALNIFKEATNEYEKILHVISNTIRDAIVITDKNSCITFWNASAIRIFGYKEYEIFGQDINNILILSKDNTSFSTYINDINRIESNVSVIKNMEFAAIHKNGKHLHVELSVSHMILKGNRNNVIIIRDISELRSNQTAILQSEKLASIGTLASGIAHEINTPIQFIGDNILFLSESFAKILELIEVTNHLLLVLDNNKISDIANMHEIMNNIDINFLKSEIPLAIEQTIQGVDRVATIVRAMKEFSHPDQREKTFIDINNAIKTTLTVAKNEIKYVAVVSTDFDENLPLVSCFPGEINQVFLNLLINAAHAITEAVGDNSNNKGTIFIKTFKENDSIVISIRDSGIGIKPEIHDKIFDPFFTTKIVGQGTGQGLAISRSVIVDKHGGLISFESDVGKGTTFYVHLPIEPIEDVTK